MKQVLFAEICKERPNAAALGAFNASLGRGKGVTDTPPKNKHTPDLVLKGFPPKLKKELIDSGYIEEIRKEFNVRGEIDIVMIKLDDRTGASVGWDKSSGYERDGYIFYDYNSKISVNKNLNISDPLKKQAIAHELRHLEQMQSGHLEIGFKGDKKTDGFIFWKGKPYISLKDYEEVKKDFSKYKQLPWEAEAYAAGDKYK